MTKLLSLFIYMAPTIVAVLRKHKSARLIGITNLFFGFTGIGWIITLLWASNDNIEKKLETNKKTIELSDSEYHEVEKKLPEVPHASPAQKKQSETLFASLKKINTNESDRAVEFAQQAEAQLPILQKRYAQLYKTLESKLSPNELTFSRYHSAAAQVYDSVLGNLSITVSIFKSMDGINTEHITKRLRSLDSKKKLQQADKDEQETLKERMSLFNSQIDKISVLLTKNEIALTKLAHLSAELAEMNIVEGRVPTEFESSIREMEQLVDRVKRYEERAILWKEEEEEGTEKIRG